MKPTDEEIEKYVKGLMSDDTDDTYILCVSSAKWVRDQMKFKLLEWEKYDDNEVADTPLQEKCFRLTYVVGVDKWWYTASKAMTCNGFDHGKQLAQADYERRINELYA